MRIKRIIKRQLLSVLIVPGAMLLNGCATQGMAPVQEITKVEMAINEARESNAITYAPLELRFAQDKLQEAKAAVDKEEFEKARSLAEEALLDAKLAEAKSRSEKAKKLAKETRENIDTLRREIDRAQKVK